MYTFSPMMVANSRKHHCRVRPYTREVLVLSTNLESQTKHYPLVFRNRRGNEARIKKTWYNQDGLSEGAGFKPEVLDELKGKTNDKNEGADDKTQDVNDEEYVHIDEYLYDDVNVKMKDAETTNEGREDEEMTNAKKDEVLTTSNAAPATQKEKTETPSSSSSCSVSSNYSSSLLTVSVLVIHEPIVLSSIPEITIEAHVTTISPFIPLFISLYQQSTRILTPTTTKATTLTPVVPEFETLSSIHLRVSDLEKEVKEPKNVDHSTILLATIKSEVLIVVKEYLGKSLGDTLHKVLQRHTGEFIKEHFILVDAIEELK
ncbi:hypothetical protein Tco_1029655 [Tanacetum coccineum]|uniref:Uncharacterized protein n=1 Tax=Tanacetum coccineum TaxID=301880 RepID=A0ABQ5G5L5_9ASTR